jgi:Icc-related predicted phosphoesterase
MLPRFWVAITRARSDREYCLKGHCLQNARVSDGRIRVAAAADIHCSEETRGDVEAAFRKVGAEADVILLAGDLTTYGLPEQAQVLADIAGAVQVPIVAVLGNHDYHSDREGEIAELLTATGITLLERSSTVLNVNGVSVGIVGAKGFIGGFDGGGINFGEAMMREIYAQTTADVEALDRGFTEISGAAIRIALLHYSPIAETLEGEPRGIWSVLGNERLAVPLAAHKPDLVLHGHAHKGRFQGSIDSIPVFNVAVHVMGQDFWTFELEPAAGPVSVEEVT